ncbi:MAG TPA: 30S ribosomal protein S20 [Thermodesulfobacteriota bacterium]|nr:30S ribosomal protein S20 [Thermodesulfobacteriota bacterium]
MATHHSAIKRHRQDEKRRLRNKTVRSAIKTATKDLREAVTKKDSEGAKKLLATAVSLLDRAVVKGVLHGNNASRRISRLSCAVNSMTSK